MTTYLIKYKDANGALHYKEVVAETASDAIHEVYSSAILGLILDVYVKV